MEEKKNPDQAPEISNEALDQVAGGVQAGSILKGGEGEFWAYKHKETEEERRKRESEKKKRSYL